MPVTTIPDLWPNDIVSGPATPTPVAVLRRQGEALGEKTHNFVLGEVETSPNGQGTTFTHFLMIVAPFLRYRKALLCVSHGLEPFPANVRETELTAIPNQQPWSHVVKNEQELQDRLREFFNEDRVKTIIRSVVNLSNDVVPPEPDNR